MPRHRILVRFAGPAVSLLLTMSCEAYTDPYTGQAVMRSPTLGQVLGVQQPPPSPFASGAIAGGYAWAQPYRVATRQPAESALAPQAGRIPWQDAATSPAGVLARAVLDPSLRLQGTQVALLDAGGGRRLLLIAGPGFCGSAGCGIEAYIDRGDGRLRDAGSFGVSSWEEDITVIPRRGAPPDFRYVPPARGTTAPPRTAHYDERTGKYR